MKTIYTALLIVLFTIAQTSSATNYTNTGSNTNYSLATNDTLRVVSGSYGGKIQQFSNGAVIIVSTGAYFNPSSLSTLNGKIINHGICVFNGLATSANFKLENYSYVIIDGTLSLYDGSTQVWINNVAATIYVTGDFSMNNASFTNFANMTVQGNFSMYTSTSSFINRGLLTVTKDINISAGTLLNQNRIVVDDVNAWGGQLVNEGSIAPKGDLTFGSGSNYTNNCLMVTNEGFTNYGTFTNNGMLWVGRTGTKEDHFYNSGTFTNAANAVVRAVKFTNYSTINGGGSYYITGDSYSSGTVGRSGTTTDSIKVYDVTRTNASRIFDTQWGTVHANVVYRPFAQPDTNNVNYAGCASYYKMNLATLLPIEWNYFTAKLEKNQPALTWSAQFEANMKFDVERSNDNVNFTAIAQVVSNNTKQYTYTDSKLAANTVAYYRIKATSVTGAVKYTEIKTLKTAGTTATATVYPNPVRNVATVQFQSEKSELQTVRVSNAAGQQMIARQVNTVKGANTIQLTEAAGWNAGVYFLEVVTSNGVSSAQRFVKQ